MTVRRSRTVPVAARRRLGGRRRPAPPAALVAADRARGGASTPRRGRRCCAASAGRWCARTTASRPTSRRAGAAWSQALAGTPFERLLREHRTEVALEPAEQGTAVTLTVTARGRGTARLGAFMMRRATRRQLDEALDGLARGARVREQVFWGWGEPGAGPGAARARRRVPARASSGVGGGVVEPPVALEDVRLRAPRCRRRLRDAARGGGRRRRTCSTTARRACCAAAARATSTCSRQRAGDCEGAPDAVVRPAGHDEVAGGAAGLRRGGRRGRAVRRRDERGRRPGGPARGLRRDRVARPRADGRGRVGRRALPDRRARPGAAAARGRAGARRPRPATLAHVPQSFEWATVGGCVATRSAGQSSTGHGRIDENVVAVRCATPAGELATLGAPASAAGPALRELVVGSEGALGVITRVALRVRPLAPAQRHEGWFARSFADGCEALRRLEQEGLAPDVARLSDETETRVSLALAGPAARAPRRARRHARARLRRRLPARAAAGRDSERAIGARRRARAPRCCAAPGWSRGPRAGGGVGARRASPGRTCATTCSTAARSSRRSRPRRAGRGLEALRDAVARALRGALGGARRRLPRLAPLSHRRLAVLHGARRARRDDPAGQWRRGQAAADRAARDARTRCASGSPPSAPPATRSPPRARRSPTTTPSGATTRRGWRPRTAARPGAPARAQGALRPGRGHEPRRAARALARPDAAHVAHAQQRRRRRASESAAGEPERLADADAVGDRPPDREAERREGERAEPVVGAHARERLGPGCGAAARTPRPRCRTSSRRRRRAAPPTREHGARRPPRAARARGPA